MKCRAIATAVAPVDVAGLSCSHACRSNGTAGTNEGATGKSGAGAASIRRVPDCGRSAGAGFAAGEAFEVETGGVGTALGAVGVGLECIGAIAPSSAAGGAGAAVGSGVSGAGAVAAGSGTDAGAGSARSGAAGADPGSAAAGAGAGSGMVDAGAASAAGS